MLNLDPLFEMIDNLENLQLIADYDFLLIGKLDIMKLFFTMVNEKYGTFGIRDPNKYQWNKFIMDRNFYYNNLNNYEYTYSPEVQMIECLFEYCYNLGLFIDETLYGTYKEYSSIYNR